MTNEKEQGGVTPDPAETNRDVQQHQRQDKEGDYRDANKSGKSNSINEGSTRKRWDSEPNRDDMNEAKDRDGKR